MPVTGYNTYTKKQEEAEWDFFYCVKHGGYSVFNWVKSIGVWECSERGCSHHLGSENLASSPGSSPSP